MQHTGPIANGEVRPTSSHLHVGVAVALAGSALRAGALPLGLQGDATPTVLGGSYLHLTLS